MTAVAGDPVEHDVPIAVACKQHSEREWNAMYPHIVRLYLGEQRTLDEVMHIMETRYNFSATESMYKKRIGRWQLHKYRRRKRPNAGREDLIPTAAAGVAESQTAGRHGVFPIMLRRANNSKNAAARLLSQPADVEIDKSARILLANMQRLTFMHRAPAPAPDVPVAIAPSGILAVTQLYVTFWLGSTLFARGHGRLAGKAVRKAFLMLEDIIKNAHFGLDWLLLDLLYDFVTRGQEALYMTLVAHLAGVAAIMLPRHHPVNLIADQLLRYGREHGDLGTLLQRAYFSKLDAVQSDPEVRAALTAQNRRVRELLSAEACRYDMAHVKLVIEGIKATHYELEVQKGWTQPRSKRPSPPPPPPPTSSLVSSPSSSAFAPSRSAATKRGDNSLLPEFIRERTQRSLSRMETKRDALTLCVADRMFFSEYTPELGEVYKLKARTYAHQRRGERADAVRVQREMLDVMREKTAMDVWGIIRELWALEKMLLLTLKEEEGEEGDGDGVVDVSAVWDEIKMIRAEVDEKARALLDDIPDDAP